LTEPTVQAFDELVDVPQFSLDSANLSAQPSDRRKLACVGPLDEFGLALCDLSDQMPAFIHEVTA
jgi:hypothetical protein